LKAEETNIKGCFLLSPEVYYDERGSFHESYNKKEFDTLIGQEVNFVQDNQSTSKKGVLRGLHFQKGINAQAKLIRVTLGSILDVIVDIRKNSETFGEHYKVELTATSHKILFIPKGIAHGFLTLSEQAIFNYKCDSYYNNASEGGIVYNDLDLNIDWQLEQVDLILSNKDRQLPTFKELYL